MSPVHSPNIAVSVRVAYGESGWNRLGPSIHQTGTERGVCTSDPIAGDAKGRRRIARQRLEIRRLIATGSARLRALVLALGLCLERRRRRVETRHAGLMSVRASALVIFDMMWLSYIIHFIAPASMDPDFFSMVGRVGFSHLDTATPVGVSLFKEDICLAGSVDALVRTFLSICSGGLCVASA